MTTQKRASRGAKDPAHAALDAGVSPRVIEGALDASGLRIALVASRFNEEVTERLLAGAVGCLARHGASASDCTVVRVPGAWELPIAARRLAMSGRYDAIAALGALIRGETIHFNVLATAVAQGLADVAKETGVPIGFGLLTTETVEQALERAGGAAGDKGYDAALAAIEMADLARRIG